MSIDATQGRHRDEESTPAPDAVEKPDSPLDLTARSRRYVLRKTVREFQRTSAPTWRPR